MWLCMDFQYSVHEQADQIALDTDYRAGSQTPSLQQAIGSLDKADSEEKAEQNRYLGKNKVS
jgi:hypothetical protein